MQFIVTKSVIQAEVHVHVNARLATYIQNYHFRLMNDAPEHFDGMAKVTTRIY